MLLQWFFTGGSMMKKELTIMDGEIRLAAILERPDDKPAPLVIVLHGFTSAMDRPHTIAACQAMHQAGFATLRFDLYGHGRSDGEFKNHTIFKWIENTLAVIDFARSLDFVTDIYLSGHSQGGLTAALAAGVETDHIKGLILRAPAFMIPESARKGEMLGFTFDPVHIPDQIDTIKDLTLGGNYIRTAQMIYVDEAVKRFRGPVLILHGDQDDTVPLQDSILAQKQYQNCDLQIIQGETHHFDHCTEQMKEYIYRWLKEQVIKK